MKYFDYFPKIEYSENTATNLLVRVKVREFVLSNASIYYQHRIEEGERPDTLATKYYGTSTFTWLLFYANDIYDPNFDWPMTSEALAAHITNTVGSLEIAQQTDHHYLLDEQYIIDRQTYLELPANRTRAVSVFDHFVDLNEKKREIKIIDEVYSLQIANEMRRLFL
jgi:hypothetical protein